MTGAASRDGVLLADLHVHTKHSLNKTFEALDARDSYSHPDAVYRAAKERGMDLVTFTDHDTIDGCLWFLDKHGEQPDFFMSEEVETYLPEFRKGRIHINVFGLTERQHREIQYYRPHLFDLLGYLKEEELLFSLNHIFRTTSHDRRQMDGLMDRLLFEFHCFEVQNGTQPQHHNDFWLGSAKRWSETGVVKAFVGGSDAHTLRRVASTFTGAPAATKEEYLSSIRRGESFATGVHGNFFGTATEAFEVVLRYCKNVCLDNEERFPLPRRIRHMAVATTMLPLTGIISGISTAVMFRKQTKMIRALRAGSSDELLPPAR